jgi:hypothetical protein
MTTKSDDVRLQDLKAEITAWRYLDQDNDDFLALILIELESNPLPFPDSGKQKQYLLPGDLSLMEEIDYANRRYLSMISKSRTMSALRNSINLWKQHKLFTDQSDAYLNRILANAYGRHTAIA